MKRTFSILFFVFFCQILVFAQPELKAKLDKLLEEDFLKTSEVGISVYDLTDGKSLYTYQENKLYRPASIQKLITAITGLSVLGPDHFFSTTFYHTGEIRNGVLYGDLYLVGGLDSEFIDPSMNGLIRMLSQSGIKSITGKFIADVSMTDSLYWGAGWSWDDAPYSFQPEISPLMLQTGYVEIYAKPRKKGEPAELVCTPASSYYTIKNQTVSNNPEKEDLDVTRRWMEKENNILVTGNVQSAKRLRITVSNSANFFMHTFMERAKEKGIQLPAYEYGELSKDSTAVFFARLRAASNVQGKIF